MHIRVCRYYRASTLAGLAFQACDSKYRLNVKHTHVQLPLSSLLYVLLQSCSTTHCMVLWCFGIQYCITGWEQVGTNDSYPEESSTKHTKCTPDTNMLKQGRRGIPPPRETLTSFCTSTPNSQSPKGRFMHTLYVHVLGGHIKKCHTNILKCQQISKRVYALILTKSLFPR